MKVQAISWKDGEGAIGKGAREVRFVATTQGEAKALGDLLSLIYLRRAQQQGDGPGFISASVLNFTDEGYFIRMPEILEWAGRCRHCGASLPADGRWLYCIMCGLRRDDGALPRSDPPRTETMEDEEDDE